MKTAPLFVRPLLAIDIEKIKFWEKQVWEKVTKVVGVSDVEAKQMRNDASVVPNGVNLSDFPFKKSVNKQDKTILFMGNFKWIQNTTTASWIVKDIWPKISSLLKQNAILWIVGKHIPESLRKLASKDIIFDEHAPDKTSDIYKRVDILLAPIKVGGGTSYKILEAMASGVPVVTTYLGIEGLKAKNKIHAVIAETSRQLADSVVQLLENRKEYDRIAKNARKFIEENYSWAKIAKELEGVYQDAVKK